MENLDPTNYGPQAGTTDDVTKKKRQLEKKAEIHDVVTGDERLAKLRDLTNSSYLLLMDAILSQETPPEKIPELRARAQVFKTYKDIFDKWEKDGSKAITELKKLL